MKLFAFVFKSGLKMTLRVGSLDRASMSMYFISSGIFFCVVLLQLFLSL